MRLPSESSSSRFPITGVVGSIAERIAIDLWLYNRQSSLGKPSDQVVLLPRTARLSHSNPGLQGVVNVHSQAGNRGDTRKR